MAKHMVKCFYCGEVFDANAEEYVKPNERRYAHKNCYEEHQRSKSQEEQEYEQLIDYIKQLFDIQAIDIRIFRQIKKMKEESGYSYSGILKTLVWWYEIKGNPVEKANGGLGIVPYVYRDAEQYYYNLYTANILNQDADTIEERTKEVTVPSPRAAMKKAKLFNMED